MFVVIIILKSKLLNKQVMLISRKQRFSLQYELRQRSIIEIHVLNYNNLFIVCKFIEIFSVISGQHTALNQSNQAIINGWCTNFKKFN